MFDAKPWIEHLSDPLVLVGFALFVFASLAATIVKQKSEISTNTKLVIMMSFVLALAIVVGGLWRASTQQDSGQNNQPVTKVEQYTSGNQSPIYSAKGDINITNSGVPQAVVDRLLDIIEKKDIALHDREANLLEMTNKYKELAAQEEKQPASDLVASKVEELLHKGDFDSAQASLERSFDLRMKELARYQKQAASDAYKLGLIAEIKLDYRTARAYYEKAAQLNPDNSDYLSHCGLVSSILGQYSKAIEFYDKALSVDLKLFGGEDQETATDYNNLATAWQKKGQYSKAIEYYGKALAIDVKVLGHEHRIVGIIYNNLGSAWQKKGQYSKAIEYYGKALAIYLKLFGDQNRITATIYNNLGVAWKLQGQYDKAIEYLNKALAIDLNKLGDQHPNVARDYSNLGSAWKGKGQYNKAMEYHDKALAIDVKLFGDDHPDTATDYNNLGEVLYSKDQYDDAIEYYRKALAIDLKLLGVNHRDTARDYSNLGEVLYAKGQYNKAIEYYNKALAIDESALGPDHPNTRKIRGILKQIQPH